MVLFGKKNKEETETNNVDADTKTEGKDDVKTFVSKKKYMYIALNENGEIILDKNSNPILSEISEEDMPIRWPPLVSGYLEKVTYDNKFRVEVVIGYSKDGKGKINKKEQEQAKKLAIKNARKELFRLANDKIEKAREVRIGNEAEKKSESKENFLSEKSIFFDKKIVEEAGKSNGASQQTKDIEDIVSVVESVGYQFNKDLNHSVGEVLSAISSAEKNIDSRINQDVNDSVGEILDAIAFNDKNMFSSIKNAVENQGKSSDANTKKCFEDAVSKIGQKTQRIAGDVTHCIKDNSNSVIENQNKIANKVNTVGRRIDELGESVESIEGKLHKLDRLDDISELLGNKGINISMEIPPINSDEEDIVNLVRYSHKITEQLGYAARTLIRKQETFKSQAESNANEQRMMNQKIDKAYSDGVEEGKRVVVKQLISKYADIDAIKESQDNYIHVIWTLLMELGVVIDGEGCYEKGNVLELSSEDIEKMMATYSKLETPGKYKVVKTGLSMQGETISVAQFEKVIDESEDSKNEEKSENLSASEETVQEKEAAEETT